jgi:glycosyltransferase involved in cell wall biosynthesis
MELCIAVSSIGKTSRLNELLESLAQQTDRSFVVGICDQSSDGSVTRIAETYRDRLKIYITSSMRGLSRGRNAIVHAAPADITHFMFPNDTSRLPESIIADLKYMHSSADVVVMSYMNNGRQRYRFDAGVYDLDLINVWKIIEPAMVLSRKALKLTGGFDESLGTGSSTPWQSGEGTDLLLKIRGSSLIVNWNPDLKVFGVPENHGLARKEYLIKLRGYGRGVGRVHKTWPYPIRRRIRICLVPWIKVFIPRSGVGLFEAAAISLGRVEGLIGRTVSSK